MRKLLVIIAFLGSITLMLTCQKLDLEPITKIEITYVYPGIDYFNVKFKINDLSGKKHAESGICYSINANPTASDTKVVFGVAEKGEFAIEIPDLNVDTKYYIRAYCNEGNTYLYSDIIEVKTALLTLTDYDNNVYNAVAIGTQIWMNENLKVTHYQNGDDIAIVSDNTAWSNQTAGAYCWYNNEIANKDTYGALYNYFTTVDNRILCPVGWHVPSDAEWTTLTDYLGGEDIAGGKMKEIGLTHWLKPNNDATNSSGFSALPGGYRVDDGAYNSLGEEGKWWSKTESDALKSIYRYIYNTYSTLFNENFPKGNGLSIRCIQGETLVLPTVSTTAISAVASSTSTCGGNVILTGGLDVTARGVCWSINQNPTVDLSTKTVDGSGLGTFSSFLTSLTPNTAYYVRAYATNSQGTAYGNQVTFSTPTQLADYDANTYNTVQIGTQLWMQENLKVTHYRNGDAIPNTTDNTEWGNQTAGAYCWYNNDMATYKNTYGALYNYYTTVDSRNLCPTGWHVPTDTEWQILEVYLGMTQAQADATDWRGIDQGTKMKSTTGWYNNGNGTNTCGFSAFPGGNRNLSVGSFINEGNYGYWWSVAEYDASRAWMRYLYFDNSVYRNHYAKRYGFSVRCLQGEGQVLPALTTDAATAVTATTATSGGNVTSDGGATVTARGVCWSITQNPTVDLTTKTVDGSGTGLFSSNLTNLTPNTTYYVRAYATNSAGTVYGNEVSFASSVNHLVINEINGSGVPWDFIELYNPTNVSIDISGYKVYDSGGLPVAYVIPSGTTILSGAFFVIELGIGSPQAQFGVSSSGEDVTLVNSADVIVDQLLGVYWPGAPLVARKFDGSAIWIIPTSETKGASNN
jgi:uncharacterized protein (TIGR02145 family)